VLVPFRPGVLSAYGMAVSDLTRDYVSPVLRRAEGSDLEQVVEQRWKRMEEDGSRDLQQSGEPRLPLVERSLDMRYEGQSYEVMVSASGGLQHWLDNFHAGHAARYGHAHAGRPVEVVNARVRLRIPGWTPPLPQLAEGPVPEPLQMADVWFNSLRRTAVYEREALPAGVVIAGPAVIVQMDATTVVNPGWTARTDTAVNLVMEPC
jgi:N-methylhydantoinase A